MPTDSQLTVASGGTGATITIITMTRPETLFDEDPAMGPAVGQAATAIETDDQYLDSTTDHWDDWTDWDDWPPEPEQAPSAPWFANAGLLFGLIAVAAAVLVVATVLLITGPRTGEIPNAPALSSTAPSSTPSSRSTPRPPRPQPPRPEPSPSAEVVIDQPAPLPIPAQPPEPSAAAPEEPTSEPDAAGPRINVTRTPMSFSPGKH